MITGTVEISRIRLSVSNPSNSGIITSSRTRSGRRSRNWASACAPSAAWLTSKPSCSRLRRMKWIILGSSSTTRICRRPDGVAMSRCIALRTPVPVFFGIA